MFLVLIAVLPVFFCLVFQNSARGDDAEQNYQQFLTIYRQDSPGKEQLQNAVLLLETANTLAPATYKYLFSLGALNNTLGNWQKATAWLEQARQLAVTDDQLRSIELEQGYCQTQLAKLNVENWGSPGVAISFIMKNGKVEMDQQSISRLPHRLPFVATDAPAWPLEEELQRSFGTMHFKTLTTGPFVIVSLDHRNSPEEYYEKGVKDFYNYFRGKYFSNPLFRRLVIVLSAYPEALAEATRRLYPQMNISVDAHFLGYYNPADNLIMATGGRVGYGTLLHEMIHALLNADFPEAPAWLNEGLASLYERTRWEGGKLVPLPNWRMSGHHQDEMPSLADMGQNAQTLGLHSREIDEIRLFLLYLDQQGLVDKLYQMAKVQGSSFQLQQAVTDLELDEQGWRKFLKNTFLDYQAEVAKDRGALSNPAEVRFLQDALNTIMKKNLTVDGIWGRSTLGLLLEFQRQYGLEPDGILGPKTMAQLKQQFTLARLQVAD